MKKLLLICILFPTISFAQGDISIAIGGTYLTQKPKNVDALTRSTSMLYYSYRIPLKSNWSFHPALGFTSTRYIMDGIFTKQNNKYSFGLSPDNYKLSYLQIYSARMPLLARYTFSTYNHPKYPDRVKENSVAFGGYVDYMFITKQYYKIGEKKYKEDAMIENKLTFGIAVELTALRGKKTVGGVSLSYGAMYQLSNYLSGGKSFKPLTLYIKLGFGGIKRKH